MSAYQPKHIPDSGTNGMVGYVRCLPSGALHPADTVCRCSDCGSEWWSIRYLIERLDGKGPFECDNAFHGGQP